MLEWTIWAACIVFWIIVGINVLAIFGVLLPRVLRAVINTKKRK